MPESEIRQPNVLSCATSIPKDEVNPDTLSVAISDVILELESDGERRGIAMDWDSLQVVLRHHHEHVTLVVASIHRLP